MKNSRENKYKRNFEHTRIRLIKRLDVKGFRVPFINKTNNNEGFKMTEEEMIQCLSRLNVKGLTIAMKHGVIFEDSYICGVKYREMFLNQFKWDVAEFGIVY